MGKAETVHPSVFILEECEARGWSLDMLATAITEAISIEPEEDWKREWGVNRLAIDMYLLAGPLEPSMRMGDMAEQFACAFGVDAALFRRLEQSWVDAGCPADGLRS